MSSSLRRCWEGELGEVVPTSKQKLPGLGYLSLWPLGFRDWAGHSEATTYLFSQVAGGHHTAW